MVSIELHALVRELLGVMHDPYNITQGVLPMEQGYLDNKFIREAIARPERVKAAIVRASIRSLKNNRDHEHLARWNQVVCGLAEHVLQPTEITEIKPHLARDVVVRISKWRYTHTGFFTRFQETAHLFVRGLWGEIDRFRDEGDNAIWRPPGIKIGNGQILPLDETQFIERADRNSTLWHAARKLSLAGLGDLKKAAAGTEAIDLHLAKVKAAIESILISFRSGEGVSNWQDFLRRALMRAEEASDGLSRLYLERTPGVVHLLKTIDSYRSLFELPARQMLRHDEFIRLRKNETEARYSLENIPNSVLQTCVRRDWYADVSGCVSAQLACALFCFAKKDARVHKWFDDELCSDTHDVTFAAFDKHVGEERAKRWRTTYADMEDSLKGLLPPLLPNEVK